MDFQLPLCMYNYCIPEECIRHVERTRNDYTTYERPTLFCGCCNTSLCLYQQKHFWIRICCCCCRGIGDKIGRPTRTTGSEDDIDNNHNYNSNNNANAKNVQEGHVQLLIQQNNHYPEQQPMALSPSLSS